MLFTELFVFFVTAMPALSVVAQAPAQDEIKSLPGLAVKPSFKQYSGFLNAGPNRRLHYWFAASQTSKASIDPVVIWVNAGPESCSSMLTLMMEHGPFRPTDNGQHLTPNDFSWNKVANVLFLDAPAGSGYSYDATGNYSTDDEQAADDTYLAIQDFLHKFSLYNTNDLYIVGQGHAATHVTLVVERLLEDPAAKLMGYAINNGILDERFRENSLMFFAYYHGLFGRRLWKKLTTNCCNGVINRTSCNFVDSTIATCQEAVKEAGNIIGTQGLNVFNIYAKCESSKNESIFSTKSDEMSAMGRRSPKRLVHHPGMRHKDIRWSPSCLDTAGVTAYMNREDVKTALHVQESPNQWLPCSDVVKYNIMYKDLREIIKKISSSDKVRALFYHGDVDMVSNFLGAKWFIDNLRLQTLVTYEQWLFQQQIGGYVEYYAGKIVYLTIKGAGHRVSRDKPPVSLQIITRFIASAPF
ncbi:lysosomal protective protein-like [Dermacentor andersoni]|uniref:lysosomal protective protein-like n=1 Tax=Dermacentor andersoni TaxID=34620 RepID=UPI003B3B5102